MLIAERREGRTMVQQTNGEVKTGNVDESARYLNYLRTLADLTAIASIMAVQVISMFRLDIRTICDSSLRFSYFYNKQRK